MRSRVAVARRRGGSVMERKRRARAGPGSARAVRPQRVEGGMGGGLGGHERLIMMMWTMLRAVMDVGCPEKSKSEVTVGRAARVSARAREHRHQGATSLQPHACTRACVWA